MRLDSYIRVSQVRGREGPSFISPDVQRETVRRWATAQGVQIDVEHVDLDQSGAKANRPGLTGVLERIEAGQVDGVIVAKLDRFGRSLIDSLAAIKRIDEAGGKFVSVAEQFDTSTPTGKLVLRIMLSLAEFELDRIREQWQVARARAVDRGVHVASRVPTGYRKVPDGTLIPDPDDAEVIRQVFVAKAAGASWADLARLLNDAGVVGPYGAKQWTQRAMSHMLTNRVYLGEARSGEFRNPDAHPPIVDRALFEAAQRARGGPAVRSDEPALLSGLLRCAGCRHLMKPDKMTMRDKSRARIYRCRGKHASGNCENRVAVLAHVIEPWVVEQVLERERVRLAGHTEGEAVPELVAELEAAEAELVAFRDDERIVGALGQDRFVEGLRRRAETVEDVQRRLADVQSRPVGGPSGLELATVWPSMLVQQQQRMLRASVDAIVLRGRFQGRHVAIGERALILWAGEMPDDWPRRGKRVPFAPFVWPDDGPADAGVHLVRDAEERALDG